MSLIRKIIAANLLESSPSPKKCQFLLHSVSTLRQSSMYTTSYTFLSGKTSYTCTSTSRLTKQQNQSPNFEKPKPNQSDEPSLSLSSEIVHKRTPPRPGKIPWQAKKANSVNLIGRVQVPVQFHASTTDDKYWAVTIISQDQGNDVRSGTSAFEPPPFWIAVIFEGDLAHIAACHLKEKDLVYIDGRLTADPPPFTIKHGHVNAQVLANGVNFVLEYSQHNKTIPPKEVKRTTTYSASKTKGGDPSLSTWRDLLKDPEQWWDCRENKLKGLVKPKYPDFKHKDGKQALWLSRVPDWVLSGLQGLKFDTPHHITKQVKDCKASKTKGEDPLYSIWRDLLKDPKQWWDYREYKLNRLVTPKHPDFLHKDRSLALWLNRVPDWVLSGLQGLKFDTPNRIRKQLKDCKDLGSSDSWKNLVANPEKWWDNRSEKVNEKAPDFKHKDTGEALWLNKSPAWVLSKLPPPLKAKPKVF